MSNAEPLGASVMSVSKAIDRRGRWPGLVWAIPAAAMVVVIYLGLQAYAERGIDVVVTFGTSGGARAGDTPVVYKGVTIGHVEKIQISQDIHHVDMTLRLDPRTGPVLREGAKFWLIGAQPSLTDLSSLRAAISGVSIGASPGTGAPARRFQGLDAPPAQPPNVAGSLFKLRTDRLGSLRVGSGIYYKGLEVGRVTSVALAGPGVFLVDAFVEAPRDQFVHRTTLFYATRAFEVSLGRSGVSAALGPGNSSLAGGVEFDDPDEAAAGAPSPPGAQFTLYQSRVEAEDPMEGPQVPYQAVFRGASAAPEVGAPVEMSGVRIGKVIARRLSLAIGAPTPAMLVTLEVEPAKLNLTGADGADPRKQTDAALAGLLRGGYRIRMVQSPPLVGPQALAFVASPGAGPGMIRRGAQLPQLPTAASADFEALTDRAVSVLDKVNAIPITAIGADLHAITSRLRTVLGSPKLTDILDHLDGTLTQLDEISRTVRPKVGPLVTKLDAAADQLQGVATSANALMGGQGGSADASLPETVRQLTEAARSIRELADYLGRHPEAVLRGKAKP